MPIEGRVEILRNNIWGTVCHDYWDQSDAKVVCRQLGLPHGSPAALGSAFFGYGSGTIWLDDVGCLGHEATLTECNRRDWGVHNCQHHQDASVICIDGEF